jgi:LacI family gluconate utilization system Gnt-I transcriptional repressor
VESEQIVTTVNENRNEHVPRRRRKMQRVTMTEVAQLARVSPSTVSLYLRRPGAVSADAGRSIERAIGTLGYVPNLVAGGLAAATSRVVGIIVPSIRNAFFAETVFALQSELATVGLQSILGNSEYAAEREEALVRMALSWAPAAIVLTGLQHAPQTRRMLQVSGIPVVEMWELGPSTIDMAVGFSHMDVGVTAARHLISKGRRRLGFLGARLREDRRAAQRAEGFASHCRAAGLAACEVLDHPGPATVESGSILLGRIQERLPDFDGLACSNDLVALGVLFEAERRGIKIPDAFSVVGFGDLEFSASCIPPLTTIRPAGELIGLETAKLIFARLGDKVPGNEEKIVDTGHLLVERGSS